MNAHWAVAKYIADQRRNEPVNVGVLVWTDGSAAMRVLGQKDDGIDGRVARLGADLPNYKAWFEYWRYRLETGGLGERLPQLRAGDNFFVEPRGELLFGPEQTAQQLADALYGELVERSGADSEAAHAETFAEQVEDLLLAADLLGRPELRRDYKVTGTTAQHWTFRYAWVNGHVTLGYLLPRVQSNLADTALWRLTNVPGEMRKVLFVPRVEQGDEATVQQLEQAAHVAEVDTADPADIREMITAA